MTAMKTVRYVLWAAVAVLVAVAATIFVMNRLGDSAGVIGAALIGT